MVGRDDQRKRLLHLTRGFNDECKLIPIVGMGGIGKSTLAKQVFDDPSILSHFDVRAWATVSQNHNRKRILLSLLHSANGDVFYTDDESVLADVLKKCFMGRRYLIVLDDIWTDKAWDDVRQCFPSQNNGSRVLLTTRYIEVARYASPEYPPFQVDFMDRKDSWNVFKSAVFPNETFPSELESIGKQIVDKCQRLPLTIAVIAGLLSRSKRTIEEWETVAKNVQSFVTDDPNQQCLNVLGLSYNHLPSYLKACLLYFAVFPEGGEIPVKRLVRLWIAEGFLKLEEEGEKCLKNLIDRSLVLISKKSLDGTEIKSCKVHGLIYELCLREAQSESFFVMNDVVFDDRSEKAQMRPFKRRTDEDDIDDASYRALLTPVHHHLIRRNTDDDDNNLLKRTHAIFSFSHPCSTFNPKLELIDFNLLGILDLSGTNIDTFPPQIPCLVWLRYLVLSSHSEKLIIPPEVCRLWNLQTFIVEGTPFVDFPKQIWELVQLRHLKVHKCYLPNPPISGFPNIQTISGLSPCSCTKEVISGLGNAKKLKIHGDEEFQESRLVDNLDHLHQLEKLSFELNFGMGSVPKTLKKLKLFNTRIRWEDLNIVGELPNLEVLKLKRCSCYETEWSPIAGGFTRLMFLLIDNTNLKHWTATSDNFPVLEYLFIRRCRDLEEIPIEFAEITSLKLIELRGCTEKLKASAFRIQQEQEYLGNKPVEVHIQQSLPLEQILVLMLANITMTAANLMLMSSKMVGN